MSKKPNSHFAIGLAAVAGSLALSSCVADPYGGGGYASGGYSSGGYSSGGYSSGGYGGSGYGYGQGYGYGGSSFSTTTFISTGSPRWGYDPSVRAYYDYNRRAYYDPYLYGYYPVGYRPVVVYAAPHPYGWSPGYNTISPPSRVTSITLSNYDRHSAYRGSDYSWARQVESAPAPSPSNRGNPDERGNRPAYPPGSQRPTYPQTYQNQRSAPIDPLYSTSTQPRASSQGLITVTTPQPYVQSGQFDGRGQASGRPDRGSQAYEPSISSGRVVPAQPAQATGGIGRPTAKPTKTDNRGIQTAEEANQEARRRGAPGFSGNRFR